MVYLPFLVYILHDADYWGDPDSSTDKNKRSVSAIVEIQVAVGAVDANQCLPTLGSTFLGVFRDSCGMIAQPNACGEANRIKETCVNFKGSREYSMSRLSEMNSRPYVQVDEGLTWA
jgi:hypothetical protein